MTTDYDPKPAHTPGPWIVTRTPIQSRGGSNTCFQIGPFQACIYDDWGARERGVSEGQNEANARLIAAAPDLLAALNAIAAKFEGEDGWEEFQVDHIADELKAARAAIAKAEGGAQ